MATNAASHNATTEPTGSVSGPPPPVSNDVAAAAQKAAQKDGSGQNVPGQDQQGNNVGQTVMGTAGKEKTAKELEKERQKADKLAKFQAKQAIMAQCPKFRGRVISSSGCRIKEAVVVSGTRLICQAKSLSSRTG